MLPGEPGEPALPEDLVLPEDTVAAGGAAAAGDAADAAARDAAVCLPEAPDRLPGAAGCWLGTCRCATSSPLSVLLCSRNSASRSASSALNPITARG
jgi:hypothetical protein